jgi:hypothetical protein
VVWLDAIVNRTVSPQAAPASKLKAKTVIVIRRVLIIRPTVPRTAQAENDCG